MSWMSEYFNMRTSFITLCQNSLPTISRLCLPSTDDIKWFFEKHLPQHICKCNVLKFFTHSFGWVFVVILTKDRDYKRVQFKNELEFYLIQYLYAWKHFFNWSKVQLVSNKVFFQTVNNRLYHSKYTKLLFSMHCKMNSFANNFSYH